jgi:cytoskeletal protein CcmA (bactofilin family)
MVAETRKPEESPTVIGADAHFKGELSFQGSVRIDGVFEGAISTQGAVLVSQGGKVRAEVRAGSVKIDGTVEGNVVCEGRAELSPSCRLVGDLVAVKLQVHEGATFVGRCEVGPNAAKGKDAAAAPLRQISDAVAGKK